MGKLEFLEALRQAMAGLPPALLARTLAFYEQRFVDGAGVGVAEEAVAREFGDPARIAMTLRAATDLDSTVNPSPGLQRAALAPAVGPKPERSSTAKAVRTFCSVLGLTIFNAFMVVPAGVCGALLAALFAAGLGCYVGGIAITASSLAGATELVLDGPLAHVGVSADASVRDIERTRTRVTISQTGVTIGQEKAPAGAGGHGGGILIESDVNPDSRSVQTLLGFSLVLGGIALLLLGLQATRYTFVAIKRYVHMNIALLKGS